MADNQEISKALQSILIEIKNSARLMGIASEKLSTAGIGKLTEELKTSLKQRKLINDAEADSIKNHKTLTATLDAFEKQLESVKKIEEEAEKIAKKRLKSQGIIDAAAVKAALNSADEQSKRASYIKSKLLEIDITEEHAKTLKAELPLIRAETEARAKNIASTDGLRVMQDNLKKSVVEQTKAFGTFGNAFAHLKTAFFKTYEQMNRISSQGLLGTFATLQMLSPKLMMSAQDLEEVLTKNRDIINQLGGGIKGIEAFSDEIYKTGDELRYLGKDWAKAGANFIELSKKSGLTPKDGAAYRKNMNQSIESFKTFSAMFGDTPDQFKALMEGMQDDVNIRQRLNGLSKTQLATELEEQRQRAYNLKLMGLSNEEIINFNKRLSSIYDPKKSGTIGERHKNALMLKSTNSLLISQMMKGNADQQAIGQTLMDNRGGADAVSKAMLKGDPTAIAKAMADNPVWARAFADAMTQNNNQENLGNSELIKIVAEGIGAARDPILELGQGLSTAKAQGRDQTDGKTPDQIAALEKRNREQLLADKSSEAKALAASAMAYESVQKILDGPFTHALWAGVAAIMAFNTAIGIKGILGGLGTLGTGLGKLSGSIMGKGGLLSVLVRAGLAYGADKALGSMGVGGNEIDEKADAENWKHMSTWEKVQSGAARGIEGAGNMFGLSNLSNKAQFDRINDETKYLKENGNRGVGAVGIPSVVTSGATGSASSGNPGGIDPRKKQLLDFIGKYESGGSYNKLVGGKEIDLQNMTISQVLEYQKNMISSGHESSAAGKYQIIRQTLMGAVQGLGMNPNTTLFSQATQDKLGEYLLNQTGADKYLSGNMSEGQFAKNISGVWAAMPKDASGRGVNDGIGSNKAGVSYSKFSNVITSMNVPGTGNSVNSPVMSSAPGSAESASTTVNAPVPSSTTATTSSTAKPGDQALTELQKQTALLASIASNTTFKNSVNPNSYKQNTASVMDGLAG